MAPQKTVAAWTMTTTTVPCWNQRQRHAGTCDARQFAETLALPAMTLGDHGTHSSANLQVMAQTRAFHQTISPGFVTDEHRTNRATALGEPLPSVTPRRRPPALKLLSRLTGHADGQAAQRRQRFGSGSGPMASLHLLNWNLQRAALRSGDIGFAELHRGRLDHRTWRTCSKCCW
jgi:hypothetical protein